jgi:hypothetical protein
MSRYYYAASWPYGIASYTDTGRPVREVYRFRHRAVRDEWVKRSPTMYRTGRGWRSVVSSKDPDLRRLLRKAEVGYHYAPDDFFTTVEWESLEEWRQANEAVACWARNALDTLDGSSGRDGDWTPPFPFPTPTKE